MGQEPDDIIYITDPTKKQKEGSQNIEMGGTCGTEYRLESPKKSTEWNIIVYVETKRPDRNNINIFLYEVLGNDVHDWILFNRTIGRPHAVLRTSLDPSKNYEIWIRDGYSDQFTGYIRENWS